MSSPRSQGFAEFLTKQSVQIDLLTVGCNLVLAAALAFLLSRLYIRFGKSPSDRRRFAGQFVLLTVTTAVIIVAVKSSLALSLGLVGALSIVRFRSAVREHEELAFLFVCIALGLCLGADQRGLALLGFGVIVTILMLRGLLSAGTRHENLYLRVSGTPSGDDPLKEITDVLEGSCTLIKLKRFDRNDQGLEASFRVEFKGVKEISEVQKELQARMGAMSISVIDGEGIA